MDYGLWAMSLREMYGTCDPVEEMVCLMVREGSG